MRGSPDIDIDPKRLLPPHPLTPSPAMTAPFDCEKKNMVAVTPEAFNVCFLDGDIIARMLPSFCLGGGLWYNQGHFLKEERGAEVNVRLTPRCRVDKF